MILGTDNMVKRRKDIFSGLRDVEHQIIKVFGIEVWWGDSLGAYLNKIAVNLGKYSLELPARKRGYVHSIVKLPKGWAIFLNVDAQGFGEEHMYIPRNIPLSLVKKIIRELE